MMEILFVSHKYPPATGGMEKQSFELINGMKPLAKVHTILYEGKGSRISFFLSLNKRILQTLKENPGIQVIHFNDGLIAAASLMHKGYSQIKRTATLHGLDVVFPALPYQRLIFPLFNRFDLLFAVSRATAQACRDRKIADEKIVVLNNGVDPRIAYTAAPAAVMQMLTDKYGVSVQRRKILLAMGRPVKRKGFSWFIKNVMPQLHPDFILLLIGPVQDPKSKEAKLLKFIPPFLKHKAELFLGYPSDESNIEKLLRKSPSNKAVHRLGKLPLHEITDILSIADAFIMPNIEVEGDMEGFGLVCLEAAMCGTKVFASASGGITDAIIHGKNGYLLPPGHVSSWVHQLNLLSAQPESFALKPGEIAAFTASKFNWKKMCEEYLQHFQRLQQAAKQ
ncbi:glycosyltransferase family 4 protein [Pedobacter sp. GR22-6]|uniref:glycosyltransferase family 4 protein n=1 Tax=Pedobacter sp. GR22-6 TaxID=3127957 RepID=UPI00307D4625